MEVEISPEAAVASPLETFCSKYTNEEIRRNITSQRNSAQPPLKDVIVVSELDDELGDLIRLKLKTFESHRSDAATQLLALDSLLKEYQLLLRHLSVSVFQLADLVEGDLEGHEKASIIEQIAGNILCQLVMFNERLVSDRRANVLTYLGKSMNIADGHRIPQRCGETLFGKWFIDTHQLAEMKRNRRAKTLARSSSPLATAMFRGRGKRPRKLSEADEESAPEAVARNDECAEDNGEYNRSCYCFFSFGFDDLLNGESIFGFRLGIRRGKWVIILT